MLNATLKYYLSFAKNVNRFLWSDSAIIQRKWYIKYGFSVTLLILATYIKLLYFNTLGTDTPFLLYFAIIILSTGFGGIGPGLFTTFISALLSDYYFLSPFNSLYLKHAQGIQLSTFIIESLLLISLSGAVTRANRHLRRTGEKFRALLENSSDAIIVANEKGHILYASPATKRVIGYTSKEFKTINTWDKTYPDEREMLEKEYLLLLQSPGKPKTIMHRYLHKNGSWAWIESTVTNLLEVSGINGMVCNFRNVTDKVLLERQKDDFVGVATHELKTPVTSIKAYAQILLNRFRKDGNETSARMVEKMDAQLNKLIGLIGDMLDVTKIEGGKLQFQESFYDFNELVSEVVEELQRITSDHKIVLSLDNTKKVYGDRERIGQVLTNLISNAIKYSPASEIIQISTMLQGTTVKMCVEDHGVGISKDNQHKIFERFYRVSGPDSQTFPGIGLGLYISHEIIKRQGGRIWVESEEGKGSIFCFEVPYNYQDNLKINISETHNTEIT